MRPASQDRLLLSGPAGTLEVVLNDPRAENPAVAPNGLALIAHPHPLYGGTLDNKVVQTLAKTLFAQSYICVRVNFRGVGASQGTYDEGIGETEDLLAVLSEIRQRMADLPVLLAGFSFGSFVQARVARALAAQGRPPRRLLLVAPAVGRFDVGSVPQGTLVIHGEEDDVVSLADVFAWARPQQLPVVVLPGAGHFFHGNLVELQRIVQAFCL